MLHGHTKPQTICTGAINAKLKIVIFGLPCFQISKIQTYRLDVSKPFGVIVDFPDIVNNVDWCIDFGKLF